MISYSKIQFTIIGESCKKLELGEKNMCHEKTPVRLIREGVSSRKVIRRCLPQKLDIPDSPPLKKDNDMGSGVVILGFPPSTPSMV